MGKITRIVVIIGGLIASMIVTVILKKIFGDPGWIVGIIASGFAGYWVGEAL